MDEGIMLLNTSNISYKCRLDGHSVYVSGYIRLFYNLPKLILLDPLSPQMIYIDEACLHGRFRNNYSRFNAPVCVAAHLERLLRILRALCLFSH